MPFALRAGVSYCSCGGRFIFLDLHKDRYFALSAETERGFARLIEEDALDPASAKAVERLAAAGLIVASREGRRLQPPVSPSAPRSSLVREPGQLSRMALAHALTRLVLSAWSTRVLPLDRRVALLTRRKANVPATASYRPDVVDNIARAFAFAGLIASPINQCLPRSFAVAHALLDKKVRPDLIFGVRAQPFGAHCWVQVGSQLVNESLDEVRNFVPILAV
jgi:hypothetical protein